MKPKYREVRIMWRDSNIYLTQAPRDDPFTYATITSFGEIIQEDDEQIVLAGDLVGNYDVRRVVVIPKENIVSIKKYK